MCFPSHLYMQIIEIINTKFMISLDKKCLYSELFWSAFFPHFPAFGLNTDAGKCGKNADQNTSEYGLFLRSDSLYRSRLSQTQIFPNRILQIREKSFYREDVFSRVRKKVFCEDLILWMRWESTKIEKKSTCENFSL